MFGGFDLTAWTAADSAVVPQTSYSPPPSQQPSSEAPQVATRGPLPRAGDWTCEECRNVNFAKRTRCNKCGARRSRESEDDEVPHYGGPPGLFKKGDWACTHCGNVNWARRNKCNVCNSPKPTLEDEPRTGRGGGHFDLQDPEDRLSHDSDDEEYDEFGRKKKKKRGTNITTIRKVKQIGQPQANESKLIEKIETATNLYFPPPPPCYLKGRSRSMASISSTSSDYSEQIEDD